MPYCLIVERKGKSPLIRGVYDSFVVERKKEELEERSMTGGEDVKVSVEQVSSWNLDKAQQEIKDRRVDELGVDEGARNFSHKE